MSRSARQSSKTTSKSSYRPASRPFVARAGKDSFFAPSGSVPAIQTKMTVNKPGDKFEQEADRMADMVTQSKPSVSGPKVNRQAERKLQRAEDQKLQKAEDQRLQKADDDKLQKAEDPQLQKADDQKLQKAEDQNLQKADDDKLQKADDLQLQKAEDQKLQKAEAEQLQKADDDKLQKADDQQLQKAEEEKVQRRASGDGSGAVGGSVQSAIHGKTTGGDPLPSNVRDSMERGFNADFSNVRVHTDPESASLNNQLSARAFTYQNHIFFSRDQFQPGTSSGQHLLAHELTHTIQQGHSVQRSPTQVSTTTATPTVQRLGIQDALDKFAGWANAIPGFRLLTLVLGFNPISRRSVDRNAANLLRALIELLPGGFIITQALDNHGVINKAAAWVEAKISELGDIGSDLAGALRRFLDSLSWTDIFDLGGVWGRAKKIFTEPISRLLSFGGRVVIELLKLVKDAILKPLAVLAKGTRGYDLLCALLGEDPISGEPVPPTAENLLGGFMKLIGQEEIWENIKKGNAIARAWAWFQGALSGLMGLVRAIPQRIIATITSLTFTDVVTVVGAFAKIIVNFASIAIDFVSWGLNTVWNLLEIIFDVVKPGLMGYVKRTGGALKSILKNPLPFLGNLIRAAKLGFTRFKSRFGTHLKQGLIDWLTGSLEGVYIPKAFSLGEFGKFAMSVLGITWQQIRGKIVKALGPNGERIMAGLETAFHIVKTLVTGSVAAVWNLVKAKLTNLKETLVSSIVDFVVSTIVTKAVPKLLAMFIPGAGFISAIISIYDTIMVFVQKLAKIVQVVTAFIDSIVTIAAGKIAAAANRVESILGGLLSLSISFLAGFLGLGRISSKVMDVVKKVRASVDKAIEAAVNWVIAKAKSVFTGMFKKDGPDMRTEEQKKKDKLAAIADAEKLVPPKDFNEEKALGKLPAIKKKYKLLSLDMVVDSKQGATETLHFAASASNAVSGKPLQTKIEPTGAVALVPEGSWIQVGSEYEQVMYSKTLFRRKPSGEEIPVNFLTATTSGGTKTHSYSKETEVWTRTKFSHGSKLAAPTGEAKFKLMPSVSGDNIRSSFYKDTSSKHAAIKSGRKATLMFNKTHFRSEGDASKEARFGFTKDPVSGKALVPWSKASADHEPAIAEHWTDIGGNNVNQNARESWNNSPNTYKIMSGQLNSSLKSRGTKYTQEVKINFRGPGE